MSHQDEIRQERELCAAVRQRIEELAPLAACVWNHGDGRGGWVIEVLREAVIRHGAYEPIPTKGRSRRPVNRETREKVIARDGLICFCCRADLEPKNATIDHRIPVSKGGTDDLHNLRVACRNCNSRKGANVEAHGE